jgi:hypothetical protein
LDNIVGRLTLDEATMRDLDNPSFGAIHIDKEKEGKESKEKGGEPTKASKAEALRSTLAAATRLRMLSLKFSFFHVFIFCECCV